MKTFGKYILVTLMLLSLLLSTACASKKLYAQWVDRFSRWKESEQGDWYGFIAMEEYQAFVCSYEGEMYFGRLYPDTGEQELYYNGQLYRFTKDSSDPDISAISQEDVLENYTVLMELVVTGIEDVLLAAGENYSGREPGESGVPVYCNYEDQYLFLDLPSEYHEDEFAFIACKESNFKFIYNVSPYASATKHDHAIFFSAGTPVDALEGWEGHDIRGNT